MKLPTAVLIPEDYSPGQARLSGVIRGDCYVFGVSASILEQNQDHGCAATFTSSHPSQAQQAGSTTEADCFLTKQDGRWSAFTSDGAFIQVILYAPPKLHRHHFWALDPLLLEETSEVSSEDPASQGTGNALQSDRVDRLHELAQTFSPASESRSLDFEEVLDVVNEAPSFTTPLQAHPEARSVFNDSLGDWNTKHLQKDVSALLQQCSTRAGQLLQAPSQLRLAHSPSLGLYESRSQYVRFYTTLWLVLNDVIVGAALGSLLLEHKHLVSLTSERLIKSLFVDYTKHGLAWLNAWPLGLKLNTELADFFCVAFTFFIDTWEFSVIRGLCASLPTVVEAIGYAAFGGTTFALACFSDLLSVYTFHLWISYCGIQSIYSWHLSVLYALANVFRGKKYNVIRQRSEPATYERDRLFLGTILFTLATFLFPTVLAFYLLFAVTRVAILFLHAANETVLAFVNHFPLFAIMLRIKDPGRLPGGLQLSVTPSGNLLLQNRPISFGDIFGVFLRIWQRLVRHYSPQGLFMKAARGQLVRPISGNRLRSVSQLDDKKNV